MDIYNYHAGTGEFVSQSQADESPLERGVYLMPANATDVAPPSVTDRETAVFVSGQWEVKPDYRGVVLYSTADGLQVLITAIGVSPTDINATETPPPSVNHSWQNGSWSLDAAKVAAQLTQSKTAALAEISDFAKAKRASVARTSDDGEIAGWPNKLRIAQAISAGTATEADEEAFEAEIAARGIAGETLALFVQKVFNNAALFSKAAGLIDGHKRAAQDVVKAATTTTEIDAAVDAMKVGIQDSLDELTQ